MFRDSSIVITGGSSGFGLALAKALASKGARLTLLARDAEKLQAAVRKIEELHPGSKIDAHVVDVTDANEVSSVIEQVGARQAGIDILINNAGMMCEGRFETLGDDNFREVMETNFMAVTTATRASLPYLKASAGRLVNVASVAGLTGTFGFTAYAAAKHALVGFTDSLYFELEPLGVRVHLVCPAEFDSPMVEALDHTRSPENRAHTATIPRVDVDTVVRETLAGLERGQFCIVSGPSARFATRAARLAPRIARWIGERRVRGAKMAAAERTTHT